MARGGPAGRNGVIAWMALHRSPATTAFFHFTTFVGAPAAMTVLGVVSIVLLIYSKRARPSGNRCGRSGRRLASERST